MSRQVATFQAFVLMGIDSGPVRHWEARFDIVAVVVVVVVDVALLSLLREQPCGRTRVVL